MRATITIVVVVLLAGLGWYTYQHRGDADALDSVVAASDSIETTSTMQPVEQPDERQTTTENALDTVVSSVPVEAEQQLEFEAETFIETLTEVDPEPVAADNADHFVSAEQSISLVSSEIIEHTTIEELRADTTLDPNAPITVVKAIEQVETLTPEKLIAQSGGDLTQTVTVLENDEPVEITVKQALGRHSANPDVPISVIKTVRYYQITTPQELLEDLDLTVQGEQLIGIIRKPYRLEEATISELLAQEKLLDPDAIFYVRTVRNTDHQGIWGIVHGGLISNFSRGVAIRRGEEVNTYQVEIPTLADEVLANHASSFLGRLIYRKTGRSYVYNFRENRMGRNPNKLNPGQEIVIIKFSAEELIEIFKHFASQAG